jgi:hypothetical protein
LLCCVTVYTPFVMLCERVHSICCVVWEGTLPLLCCVRGYTPFVVLCEKVHFLCCVVWEGVLPLLCCVRGYTPFVVLCERVHSLCCVVWEGTLPLLCCVRGYTPFVVWEETLRLLCQRVYSFCFVRVNLVYVRLWQCPGLIQGWYKYVVNYLLLGLHMYVRIIQQRCLLMNKYIIHKLFQSRTGNTGKLIIMETGPVVSFTLDHYIM